MKNKLTKHSIRKIVERYDLRDISELKTFCSVQKKLKTGDFYISGHEVSEIEDFIEKEMKVMTFPEYLKATPRTLNDLGTQEDNEMHMVLGVLSEAGEVAGAYKKNFAYGVELDRINVSEELGGDVMWYISNWYNIANFSIYRSMYSNIAKLKIRYPDGFSEEKALNRDKEAERQCLEEHLENSNEDIDYDDKDSRGRSVDIELDDLETHVNSYKDDEEE